MAEINSCPFTHFFCWLFYPSHLILTLLSSVRWHIAGKLTTTLNFLHSSIQQNQTLQYISLVSRWVFFFFWFVLILVCFYGSAINRPLTLQRKRSHLGSHLNKICLACVKTSSILLFGFHDMRVSNSLYNYFTQMLLLSNSCHHSQQTHILRRYFQIFKLRGVGGWLSRVSEVTR